MTTSDLIDQVEEVRRDNNRLWMQLLRIALKAAPEEAKATLTKINENDKLIGELLGKVAADD